MKALNLTLSLLLTFVLFMPAYSQVFQDFGIKAGATISNIQVTDIGPIEIGNQFYSVDYIEDNVANPSVACYTDLFKLDNLDVQAELSYMRKGATRTSTFVVTTVDNPDGNGQTVSFTNEIGLHYLGLALIAQPWGQVGDARLYTIVGPTFSYLLGSSGLLALPDQLSKFQVGYTVGVGVDPSKIVKANVFLEIRYNGDVRYFYDAGAKFWNRSWLFCVGTKL